MEILMNEQELEKLGISEGDFRRSSFTDKGKPWDPLCVEVAIGDNVVAVRNSNDPMKNTLICTPGEWGAFIRGVKAGEFD